jgi:small subunit ribosomal protein S6
MFIVKPELDEEQVTTATDRVHQLVVANGGNVTKTASWGKRRLAYRVGQYREGYYVVSNFDVEPAKIGELERVLKISDTVFRHLLVKRDMPAIGQQEVVVPEATPEDLAALYEPAVTEEETEAAPAAVIEEDEDAVDVEPGQVEASAADPDSVEAETTAEAPAAALQEAVAATEPAPIEAESTTPADTEDEAAVAADAHEEAGHEPK